MSQHQLVIAEKPSVAQSIAAVLGATQRKDGYLEGNGYIVSWCVGHLVQLAPPEAYDTKYAKWRREDLPILPERWQYVVSPGTQKQFAILQRLMSDSRVVSLVCATDAGREGELIFRLVYEMTGCTKPVSRLWISSLEESAIREGFQILKPASEYDRLYQAALCRAKADWLVGMNATRLLSAAYNRTLSVGRVMTPTLSIMVGREAAIASFQPTPYYSVVLDCGGFSAASERMSDRGESERIARLCDGKDARVERLDCQEKREKPPWLYDLTTLQRDANRLHGFTAQQTLDYVQSMYEKKLCTYPRTESQYLPENMRENAIAVLEASAAALRFAQQLPPYHDIGQILNDKNVTDHHAIIPTRRIQNQDLASLPAGERAVMLLIISRLMCAVSEAHAYAETTVQLLCEGMPFTAKGRQTITEGWRAALALFRTNEPPAEHEEKVSSLPAIREGEVFSCVTASIKEGKTTPPKHFTEDSLLATMERAGAMDAPEDAEHKGLGTPATRAGTIEKLVRSGFVDRTGDKKTKHLLPTQKGAALAAVAPESIQSPLLTSAWEHKLKQIERGELSEDAFMAEITGMLQELIRLYERSADADTLFPSEYKVIGACLRCGSHVVEKPHGFFCENNSCRFALWKNNYFFAAQKKEVSAKFVATLLQDGKVLMRGLKSKKTGMPYDAYLTLDPASPANARFRIELLRKDG